MRISRECFAVWEYWHKRPGTYHVGRLPWHWPRVGSFGLKLARIWLPYARGVRGGEAAMWHAHTRRNSTARCIRGGVHGVVDNTLGSSSEAC